MSRWLDRWQDAGAKKFMDFRELAAAIGRRLSLEERDGELLLRVESESAPALVRPLTIVIRIAEERLPSRVSVFLDDGELSLQVHPLGDGLGRVILPCASEDTAYG